MELKEIFIMGGSDESSIVPIFPRTDLWDFNVLCERSPKTAQKKKSHCMEINGACLDTGYYYIVQGQFLFSDFLFCGANCVLCSVFCGSTMFLGSFYLPGVWKTNFFRPLVSGHCPKCKSKLILFS